MELQKVLSLVRQAVDDYSMIEEGDRIAVGISGGKDSLTLLYALSKLKKFYPKRFELEAITVDLGLGNVYFDKVKELCDSLQIPYHIINTEIGTIIFKERNESNPCSLCSKMRKGALNTLCLELHCNKVAYAHHRDDVVETMMLSMLFEGRLHTFSPVTKLDKTGITIIRPLVYMQESEVKGFVNKYNLPVVKSPCPVNKKTKREYVHELLQTINKENPGIRNKIFTAIKKENLDGWKYIE